MKRTASLLILLLYLPLFGQVNNSNSVSNSNAPVSEGEGLDTTTTRKFNYGSPAKSLKLEPSKTAQKEQASLNEQKNTFVRAKKNSTYQSTQRNPNKEQQQQMDGVVEFYKKNAPQSFEYHYYSFVAGNYDVKKVSHLFEAKRMNPKNADVHIQLAAYFFITGNKEMRTSLTFLYENGRIEPEMLQYARHLLACTAESGTLIVHGYDDMYAALYVQQIEDFRKDIELISMDFLQSEHYRKLLTGKGYKSLSGGLIDVTFIQNFCRDNADKKISLSLTIPKTYFEPLQDDFDIIGLTLGPKNQDAFRKNANLLEEFKQGGGIDRYRNQKAKLLSSNYLPMLILLKKSYEESGEKEKAKELNGLIDRLSQQCKKDKIINNYK